MQILVAALVMLWIVVIALAVLVFALARQIGVLHERSAPMGALMVDAGPDVGHPMPHMSVPNIEGVRLHLGGVQGQAMLMLFVGVDCPICKKMLPLAKDVARREQIDLVLIGDDSRDRLVSMVSRQGLEALPFINSSEPGMRLKVGKLPYAYLVDERGVVAAKGLVNTREHLESLITAKEIGVASAQQYLRESRVQVAS